MDVDVVHKAQSGSICTRQYRSVVGVDIWHWHNMVVQQYLLVAGVVIQATLMRDGLSPHPPKQARRTRYNMRSKTRLSPAVEHASNFFCVVQ